MSQAKPRDAQYSYPHWAEDLDQYIPASKIVKAFRNRHGNWSIMLGPKLCPTMLTFHPNLMVQYSVKVRHQFGWFRPKLRILDNG